MFLIVPFLFQIHNDEDNKSFDGSGYEDRQLVLLTLLDWNMKVRWNRYCGQNNTCFVILKLSSGKELSGVGDKSYKDTDRHICPASNGLHEESKSK